MWSGGALVHFSFKNMTSAGNNDFPANQLNKFRANTAESIPVQTYTPVCHVTNLHCEVEVVNRAVTIFDFNR